MEKAHAEKQDRPITPEEYKWRASVYSPENVRRKLKLQYWLLAAWSALTVGWIAILCFDLDEMSWMTVVVLVSGYVSVLLGIVNSKRILVGKKPWG